MVNPAICRKCPNCSGVEGPIRDEDDSLIATTMIHCGVLPDIHADSGFTRTLLVDSEVPSECPYLLEHKLTEEHSSELQEGWDEERAEQ